MLSVVIPLFNEEQIIAELHRRLTAAARAWNDTWELVFVDDGSYDHTPHLLQRLAEEDAHVVVIALSRNFGHQAALSAGLAHAQGDAVIIMDGDLQDPPEVLERFVAAWRAGSQVVYGVRTRRKEPRIQRYAYALFYRTLRCLSDVDIPLDSGDFCLMDRRVVDVLNQHMPERIRFIRGLRAYAGFTQCGIEYERDARVTGKSKYSFRRLLGLALDGIFDYSTVPLRLAAYLGFAFALISGVIGLSIIVRRIFNISLFGAAPGDVQGFTTLALGMFFLGGVILIVLGVMGEYLRRIYIEVKQRPFYVVRDVTRGAPQG